MLPAPRRSRVTAPVRLPRAACVRPTASCARPRHSCRSAAGADFQESSSTSWAWNGRAASSSRCASVSASSGVRTWPSVARSSPGAPYGSGRPSASRGRALRARPARSRSRSASTDRSWPTGSPASNPAGRVEGAVTGTTPVPGRNTQTVSQNRALVGLTVAATGALLCLGALPATAADTATVSILHAVPDTPVDVYANGEELLPDFQPGTLTDPLELPAGTYDLAVYPAGADPATTDPAISAEGVEVPAGANATVVAHLGEDGTPVLTPFVNDVSAVPAGQARVTVRHTAAAPAVDVRAGGTVVAPGLTNPDEATLTVPAGTVSADVVLAGTGTVAIGPADLDLREGTVTAVYAWGSADAGYQLAVQTLTGMSSAPSGVPAGSGGLADDGLPVPLLTLAGAGLVATTLAGRRL